jgi:hypothetical protein
MYTIETSLQVPESIALGLSSGTYERVGGVIREAKSKHVVTWLREGYKTSESGISNAMLPSPTSMISNSMNLALSNISAITSTLNLAISTMGFVIVLKRLGFIEQQLGQAQKAFRKLDYKIDLSFYANFRAALDLAINAFTMSNSESRKLSAMQAINRFLEAEQHYAKLASIEIANGSSVADNYLSTLCLAYVTEARCYLELEEIETARRRLQEGTAKLRPFFERHVNTLLTSNPAAYLHPSLKKQIGLKHLTRVYQWMEPELDEGEVFEKQRENLFRLAQNSKAWMNSLPPAICLPKGVTLTPTSVFDGFTKQSKKFIGDLPSMSKIKNGSSETASLSPEATAFYQLPAAMALMEAMIEDNNRLTMYESEIEIIHKLGMSFQEWQQLAPSIPAQGNGSDLIYITVSK